MDNDIDTLLELSKIQMARHGIRKILVNGKYLYMEYKKFGKGVIEILDVDKEILLIISNNLISYQKIDNEKIKNLYLDKYIPINVNDLKLNNVSFVKDGKNNTQFNIYF
jgi:hypothetical protein